MSLDNGPCSHLSSERTRCAAASVATCLNAILRESIESARQGSEYTQEDVMEYYRRQKPDARLGGKRYPNTIRVSTAGVGNSLIIKALKAQAAAAGERPIVKYWLGTARKCVVKLSTSKTKRVAEVEMFAWEKLKQFFPLDSKASAGRRREVLLNHTINHYSIIFGWREWRVESGKDKGKVVRQCLTSSYHQKPKTWMPWDTVCDIIVLSKGFYTILYFSLGEAGTDAVEDEDAAADPGADAAGTESKEKQTNEEGASPEDVDADRDTALVSSLCSKSANRCPRLPPRWASRRTTREMTKRARGQQRLDFRTNEAILVRLALRGLRLNQTPRTQMKLEPWLDLRTRLLHITCIFGAI